eukprot:9471260-Alexandrium_andersonii.AAC.1
MGRMFRPVGLRGPQHQPCAQPQPRPRLEPDLFWMSLPYVPLSVRAPIRLSTASIGPCLCALRP